MSEIPIPIIAVTAKALANYYTHTGLQNLAERLDLSVDGFFSNKIEKAKAYLLECNKKSDPYGNFGKLIEEFMETPDSHDMANFDEDRNQINSILAKHGFVYLIGGKVEPIGSSVNPQPNDSGENVLKNSGVENKLSKGPNIKLETKTYSIHSIADLTESLKLLATDAERVKFLDDLAEIDWPNITGGPDTTYVSSSEFENDVARLLTELAVKSQCFPLFGLHWDKIKRWSDQLPDARIRVLYLTFVTTRFRQRSSGYPDVGPFRQMARGLQTSTLQAESELEWQSKLLEHSLHKNGVEKSVSLDAKNVNNNRRYQVFVSSTYEDLIEEREGVIETLLKLGCFPAAMEWFTGVNIDKWDVISPVIESSDYFVVILAGKYGSGFAEREYDYAVECGIPIAAFVHSDTGKISSEKVENDPHKIQKLKSFRDKVETKMTARWNSPTSLAASVSTTLHTLFLDNPRPGWVRGEEFHSPVQSSKVVQPNRALTSDKLSTHKVAGVQTQLKRLKKGQTLLAAYIASILPVKNYKITEFHDLVTKFQPLLSIEKSKGKGNTVTAMWNPGRAGKLADQGSYLAKPTMPGYFRWNDVYDQEAVSSQIRTFMVAMGVKVPDNDTLFKEANNLLKSIM